MSPQELIAAVGARLGLRALSPTPDGIYEVVFDGDLDLQFLPLEGNRVLLRAFLGPVPDDEVVRQSYPKNVLNWKLAKLRDQQELVTIDREYRKVCLYRLFRSDKTDEASLYAAIEEFLNTLEWWRQSESPQGVSPLPFSFLRP